ncbi:Mis12 protein-domain-containing protein [Phialemonium atrogriseum]|uniref:Mis12 protein-domain-containing protein n=1 Tax=Phialemonium atrogriseum TaxID=1093897 RepID=A0AAJ0C398_9PEZI|nr:Mis12 protein-domain-containing protein [Phialemonium atrogriseum]KAK1769150.1 Mis12 protein-domain-containing protein [Phialemonium atrogriseum]
MATTTNSDTALLTEHFGYPPVSLLDDIINSVNILAERALNSVEQGLLSQPPANLGFKPQAQPAPKSRSRNNNKDDRDENADPAANQTPEDAARHEIENGTHQLETLLCASIDRNFDKFELWVMQNVLCIRRNEDRDWIRLSHYNGLDFDAVARRRGQGQGPTKDSDSPSVDNVRRLRRRLQASQKLNGLLHAERARNDELLRELRSLVGTTTTGKADVDADAPAAPHPHPPPLAFLRDQGALTEGDAETPLATTAAFTLSQLQALRALSTALRNVLPDLSGGGEEEDGGGGEGGSGGDRNKSWRRQRLEYVETATKRHLENVRGLELGRGGEVIDGEWQGEGRSVGRGEVEGLEKVVAILGPGPGHEAGKGDEMDES